MIINQCVEQGIYVVLILSLEKDHRPLRSSELSAILSVSDSYLKKILRKLVLAGIIVSAPGKEGGFQLARSIEDLSVYHIYSALEGAECDLKMTGIGRRIFRFGKDFGQGEKDVVSVFRQANEAFLNELKKLILAELVSEQHYRDGTIEFSRQLKEAQVLESKSRT